VTQLDEQHSDETHVSNNSTIDLEQLRSMLGSIESFASNTEQQLSDTRAELKTALARGTAIEQDSQRLQAELDQVSQQLSDKQAAFDAALAHSTELEQDSQRLQSELEQVSQQLSDKQAALDAALAHGTELELRSQRLQSELEQVSQKLSDKQAAFDAALAHSTELEQQSQRLQSELEQVSQKLSDKQTALVAALARGTTFEQDSQRLQAELEQVSQQLSAKQGEFEEAIKKGREWQRRKEEVEGKLTTMRDTNSILQRFGDKKILSYLDRLLKHEDNESGVTLETVRTALLSWLSSIAGTKVTRIFDNPEVEVERDEIGGLVEFEPSNPFSEEFPRAYCRVIASGWRAGDIVIEKARLEVIEQLSAASLPMENGIQNEEEETAFETSISDEISELELHEVGEKFLYPEQPELQPDNPINIQMQEATQMLGDKVTPHQRELWDAFIDAVVSGQSLDEAHKAELAKWNGGKKGFYKNIQLRLKDNTGLREVVEHYWKQLVLNSSDQGAPDNS